MTDLERELRAEIAERDRRIGELETEVRELNLPRALRGLPSPDDQAKLLRVIAGRYPLFRDVDPVAFLHGLAFCKRVLYAAAGLSTQYDFSYWIEPSQFVVPQRRGCERPGARDPARSDVPWLRLPARLAGGRPHDLPRRARISFRAQRCDWR